MRSKNNNFDKKEQAELFKKLQKTDPIGLKTVSGQENQKLLKEYNQKATNEHYSSNSYLDMHKAFFAYACDFTKKDTKNPEQANSRARDVILAILYLSVKEAKVADIKQQERTLAVLQDFLNNQDARKVFGDDLQIELLKLAEHMTHYGGIDSIKLWEIAQPSFKNTELSNDSIRKLQDKIPTRSAALNSNIPRVAQRPISFSLAYASISPTLKITDEIIGHVDIGFKQAVNAGNVGIAKQFIYNEPLCDGVLDLLVKNEDLAEQVLKLFTKNIDKPKIAREFLFDKAFELAKKINSKAFNNQLLIEQSKCYLGRIDSDKLGKYRELIDDFRVYEKTIQDITLSCVQKSAYIQTITYIGNLVYQCSESTNCHDVFLHAISHISSKFMKGNIAVDEEVMALLLKTGLSSVLMKKHQQ